MPLTAAGGSAASAIAARTEAAQAAQMSDDDCSTTSPASCQTAIGLPRGRQQRSGLVEHAGPRAGGSDVDADEGLLHSVPLKPVYF